MTLQRVEPPEGGRAQPNAMTIRLSFLLPLLAALAAPSSAQEERELSVPVDSQWRVEATPLELTTLVRQGYRIFDLEVVTPNPVLFSAVLVRNTGPYERSWRWWYGRTAAQLQADVQAFNGRLIDIEPYYDGLNLLYAGVAVSNTGSAQKTWYWFSSTTTTDLAAHLSANNARIVDLDGFLVGRTRRYCAITIANTGSDARAWWWYVGVNQAQVESLLTQNNAQVIDIERAGSDSFEVVMIRPVHRVTQYRYYDIAENEVMGRLSQHGGRLVDLEQTGDGFSARFDIVLVDNTDGFDQFGSGCPGSNGVLTYFGAGLPALGGSIAFGIQNGPQNTVGIALVGASNTLWSGLPLPFPLDAFGAPTCALRVSPDVFLPTFVNGAGRTISIPIPVAPELLDQAVHSQFLCPDAAANALGLITSAGVTVHIRA